MVQKLTIAGYVATFCCIVQVIFPLPDMWQPFVVSSKSFFSCVSRLVQARAMRHGEVALKIFRQNFALLAL
jgi:hypothetical protein